MLDIKITPSTNNVNITGILKELQLEEKTSADGSKQFVVGKATIKVDQEINGKLKECEIPVEMFANKLKGDGTASKLYPIVLGYKEKLTSLAACPEDQPQLASKVTISGADLSENTWWDTQSNSAKSSYKIRSNFINVYNGSLDDFKQEAKFEVSGVILDTQPETDKEGIETGRLKVLVAVVGYNGRVDTVPMIAESANAVNFINSNWNQYDTVKIAGRINMSHKVETWEEPQGFGEPIIRKKTISSREFIITSGSEAGLAEEYSYDKDDILAGLADRKARIEESKTKAPQGRTQAPKAATKYDW